MDQPHMTMEFEMDTTEMARHFTVFSEKGLQEGSYGKRAKRVHLGYFAHKYRFFQYHIRSVQ